MNAVTLNTVPAGIKGIDWELIENVIEFASELVTYIVPDISDVVAAVPARTFGFVNGTVRVVFAVALEFTFALVVIGPLRLLKRGSW
jgi:hypothetical protein